MTRQKTARGNRCHLGTTQLAFIFAQAVNTLERTKSSACGLAYRARR
jgi:hypothetical protein